jgi:hypothetical protein
MYRILVIFLTMFIHFQSDSQYFIGMQKKQLIMEIKGVYPDFVIDTTSVNYTYKYLKFVDSYNEQTLLFFLSDKDVCTATKLISNYSCLSKVQKELNKKYKSAGRDMWIFKVNGEDYQVKLKREEWFFSVIISKK